MPDETKDEVIVREFPVELSEDGDGRTIEARIVPYNTPTLVVDRVENGGTGVPYKETWLPGAFDRQTGAINRVKVWLNFEHQPGLQGIVGHGADLESRDDALYGTFRVHENADGDKALQMVRDGLLTGISLEARPLRSRRLGEVVERVRAHLEKVSLCRIGAFEQAQVLAVREEPGPVEAGTAYVVGEKGPELFVPGSNGIVVTTREPSEVELALQRIGYEPLLVRAVTRRAWNGDASRFEDDEYQRSCLIDRGGDAPVKERCSLPVLEPNGDVNANALPAAAAVLSGARGGLKGVSPEKKATAARKLIRLYSQADMEPPPSLRQVAAR